MNPLLVLKASRITPNPAKGKIVVRGNIARATPMERGLDVSHAQDPAATSLNTLLANPLYTFVIVKATEGQSLNISRYPAHRANNVKYKKRHGAYHFAWPNQDPLIEAAHFVNYAALKPGEIACLDLENWGPKDPATGVWTAMVGVSWETRIAYAIKWIREVKRLCGATTVIYMNWEWIKNFRTYSTVAQWNELCTYPLWLADYDSNAPGTFPTVNPKVAGGPTFMVWLHQWTASRPANDGGLDGDACLDPSLWKTYAVPTPVTPTPVEEDVMTDAQYNALNTRLDALAASVTKITNMLEQKANIVDVKAVSASVDALKAQVGASTDALSTTQTAGFTDLAAVANRTETKVGELGQIIPVAIKDAVKSNLSGFQVNTTMQFPTG